MSCLRHDWLALRLASSMPLTQFNTWCTQAVPAVLEIPSKDNPYDPNADSLLVRVKHIFGAN